MSHIDPSSSRASHQADSATRRRKLATYWLAGGAAIVSMALGALGLLGWALDIAVLKSPAPGMTTLKANTAFGFLLCGAALWPLRRPRPAARLGRGLGEAAVVVVAVLALLTLSEHLFSWNAGIDQFFFRVGADSIGASHPGRMAWNSAFSLLAASGALLLLLRRSPGHSRSRALPFVEFAAGIAAASGLVTLLGYAAQLDLGYGGEGLVEMAIYAAVGFLALGVGLFAVAWRKEQLAWVVSKRSTAAFVGALAVMLFLTTTAHRTVHEMAYAAQSAATAHEIRYHGSNLLSAVQDIELGTSRYAVTGDEFYLARSASAKDVAVAELASLRQLLAGQAGTQQPLQAVEPLIALAMASADAIVEAYRLDGAAAATAMIRTVSRRALISDIRGQLDDLDNAAERQARQRQAAADTASRRAYTVLPLGGLFSLVVFAVVLLGMNREMAARHAAATAARRSERRFRAAFEQSAIGFALTALDGRFLRVNDRLCDMVGYGREELQQRTIQEITHPEDLEVGLGLAREALADQRQTYVLDKRCIHKNGSAVWVNVNASLVRSDGAEPGYFVVAVTDITARRNMETQLAAAAERFQLAVRASTDTIWDWEVKTDVTWRSKGLQEHYGYADDECEPSTEWWLNRIHPEDRERVRGELRAALDSKRSSWVGEYRFQRRDGSYANVIDRGYIVRDAEGKPTRLVGGMSDITERTALEDQLRQAQKIETIGQLAGGIAHDFNNLLTVISGTAELAALGLREDDPAHKDWDTIRGAASRAAALTTKLLAFSRRQVLLPTVVNLNTVVADVEPLLQRLIGEQIAVTVHPAPELGNVCVDVGQVEQVILNLATNSRDAMPNGGRLGIATANVTLDDTYAKSHHGVQPGPYVLLAVSDTGCGMNEAEQQKIFEPFFTTKPPGKGTGLGLATAHGIVKQSGGHIWVYSEVGKGTTIKLYFPRIEAAAVERTTVAAPSYGRGNETILVVEDVDSIRTLARRILEKHGYTVLDAATGEEALQILGHHAGPVHLLLTDVVMPGMGGVALAEHLKGSHPEMKVLFMSGHAADGAGTIVREGVIKRDVHFVGKPFMVADLIRKVQEILGG